MCLGFFISCSPLSSQNQDFETTSKEKFDEYWYNGTAELNRYHVEQARYGEIHEGEAVLIFVTEDFKTDAQVKYEFGDRKNVEPILKLNYTKKFFTGLYPYSLMNSIFTPVDLNKKTFKLSSSSQEWCGHTYSQYNLNNKNYEVTSHSYFQNEADQKYEIGNAQLEDEIWNTIRLDPSQLKIGEIKIIPSALFTRLSHEETLIEDAVASLSLVKENEYANKELISYSLEYKNQSRKLIIFFEKEFPYQIYGWEEHGVSGFKNPKNMVTKAKRTHSINKAYWENHNNEDASLKKELGLDSSNY